MKLLRRPKLHVEQLEQRECPALTVSFYNGLLNVSGTPTGGPSKGVLFTLTANNQWQLKDAGFTLGKYNASSVNLRVTHHQSTPITFDLNGLTASGNIQIDLGNGNTDRLSQNGVSVYNGTLGGNLTVLNGSGIEVIHLGYVQKTAAISTKADTRVGGDVSITGRENPTYVTATGNPDGTLFDTGLNTVPTSTAVVTIGGSLTTFGVSGVGITPTTTIGKNLSVSTLRAPLFEANNGLVMTGKVGGNMTVSARAVVSTGTNNNEVLIGSLSAANPASIGGNLSVTFGNGNDRVVLGDFGGGLATVGGSTFIQAGDGNASIGLNALFNSDVRVQLGNGNNTNAAAFGTAFFPATAVVGGNFTLTAGHGNNNFTPAGSPFAGRVDGRTSITLGNGNNAEFVVSSSQLGGPFVWRSGNGNNALTFAAVAPTIYNVDLVFGSGDDTLTFNSAGSTFTGRADGGSQLTADVFNLLGGELAPTFVLSNFP